MTTYTSGLLAIFAAQMALGLFLMFGGPGVPWHRRTIAAFGSAGMAISLAAILFAPPPLNATLDGAATLGLIVLNAVLAFRLVNYFRNRQVGFSCLGTVGRLIGCAFVAWGVFALVTLCIALGIGFVGVGSNFFSR